MSRRFVSQLGEREDLDDIFVVGEKQLRTNRNGNLYLQLRLSDKTGSVAGMMWNANEKVYREFENGDYVRVSGKTQFYNGNMQVIINKVEKASANSVDESEFLQLSHGARESLTTKLEQMLRGIKNYHLRSLAECLLIDDSLMDQFQRAPAGIKNHHAYAGGLLEHVVRLMEVSQVVADLYPEIDAELLLLGAFIHDLGKVRELTYDRDYGYSDEGQLVGHIVVAVEMLGEKLRDVPKLSGEPFPDDLAFRLKHMVVSHHGNYEFGSPKLPMTIEAVALHLLDNLDAKIHNFSQLIKDDVNVDSAWTPYHPNLGRKLYKGPVKASVSDRTGGTE